MTDATEKIRAGEALVSEGLLTDAQLAEALDKQQSSELRLGELLVAEGLISAGMLVRTLGKCMGIRACVLRHGLIDPSLLSIVGEEEAMRLVPASPARTPP